MTRKEANDFKEILAQSVSRDSGFYQCITRAFDVLAQVREQSDGHGITLVVGGAHSPVLQDFLQEHHAYNGKPHNLNDDNIVDVVRERREKDLGTVVDSAGNFVAAEVYFDVSLRAYREKYGISPQDFPALLGYSPTEDAPGGRQRTALLASDEIGSAALIITLGENRPDGRKGSIKAFYCGDRIYDDSGRKMEWKKFAKRQPERHVNVVKFPGATCGNHYGQREEQRYACAMGGPL